MPLALARLRPRLAHFPTPFVPRVVPVPYVVTVHDADRPRVPAVREAQGRAVLAARRRRRCCARARAVITDDDATVALLERFAARRSRARARDPAGRRRARSAARAACVRARPYLFYAGNHRPHKDLATLVAAWRRCRTRARSTSSSPAPTSPRCVRAARRARGELVFAGDCSDETHWRFTAARSRTCSPRCAKASGCRCSRRCAPERRSIASDAAVPAVLRRTCSAIRRDDVAALRALLLRAARGRRQRSRAERRARASATAHLTWERTVRATADVYRDAARTTRVIRVRARRRGRRRARRPGCARTRARCSSASRASRPTSSCVPVTSPLLLHPLALRAARPHVVHLPYLEASPFVPRPYVAMLHDADPPALSAPVLARDGGVLARLRRPALPGRGAPAGERSARRRRRVALLGVAARPHARRAARLRRRDPVGGAVRRARGRTLLRGEPSAAQGLRDAVRRLGGGAGGASRSTSC